jgi:hypothetical protein
MSSPELDVNKKQNPFDFSQMETRDLQEVRSQLQGLQGHMGYQIFLSQMQQQIQTRLKLFMVLEPGGIDGCINREYMRGSCSAFDFIMNFVPALVEGVEQELQDRKVEVQS